MSGWPLSCSWPSTRMKPDWSQSGRCALRLDQLKPLVLFDRERNLARAGITADQTNFGAGQVVEHGRIIARRGAGLAGADDEFPREQFLERFHGRVGAGDADVVVDGRGTEMDEFPWRRAAAAGCRRAARRATSRER